MPVGGAGRFGVGTVLWVFSPVSSGLASDGSIIRWKGTHLRLGGGVDIVASWRAVLLEGVGRMAVISQSDADECSAAVGYGCVSLPKARGQADGNIHGEPDL